MEARAVGVLLAVLCMSMAPARSQPKPVTKLAPTHDHGLQGALLPILPRGALRWRPGVTAWARRARALQQLLPPGGSNRPCVAATEHTCTGAAGTAPICCQRRMFACGTRLDTGGPRCAMCPQVCIMDCMPGYKCGKDANGCFNCLPDASSNGSIRPNSTSTNSTNSTNSTSSGGAVVIGSGGQSGNSTAGGCGKDLLCPASQACSPAGLCLPDPCLSPGACPADAKCTLGSDFKPVCTAGELAPPPCIGLPAPTAPASPGEAASARAQSDRAATGCAAARHAFPATHSNAVPSAAPRLPQSPSARPAVAPAMCARRRAASGSV